VALDVVEAVGRMVRLKGQTEWIEPCKLLGEASSPAKAGVFCGLQSQKRSAPAQLTQWQNGHKAD